MPIYLLRGSYSDSRLKDGIKSCAGNIGTQITVGRCNNSGAQVLNINLLAVL